MRKKQTAPASWPGEPLRLAGAFEWVAIMDVEVLNQQMRAMG